MNDELDDLFSEDATVSTPTVSRFAGISEATARALASDIGVGRIGPAYAWDRDHVEQLLERLEAEDDEEVDDPDGDEDEGGEDEDDGEESDADDA
jgi:hypothetical protein